MDLEYFMSRLAADKDTIRSLVAGVEAEQARWQPAPKRWSIIEVINHLYDEERDDFRMRLDLVLNHPGKQWPPIAPEKWCVEREYNARELEESLQRFVAEREQSLGWLSGLGSVDWNAGYDHPDAGRLSAGDLITSWLTHDYLHIRQLTRLLYDYTQQVAKPFDSRYAGDPGAW